MTDRTTLALAACQGLTDEELAQRGPEGYRKMRDRKRQYATAARMLAKGMEMAEAKIAKLQDQVAKLQARVAALQELDAPVTDTSEAASLLANLAKK